VASLGHLEPLLHEALRQGPELFCSDYLHSRHALGESMKQIWVCEILARPIWYRISESNRYKLQQLPRGKLYGLTIQLEQLSKGSESDDAFGCLFWVTRSQQRKHQELLKVKVPRVSSMDNGWH